MNADLAALLDRNDGVLARQEALRVVPHHVLDWAAAAGHVVRLFPGVWVEASRRADERVLKRAALCYAGPTAALSHRTALAHWGFPITAPAQIDLSVATSRRVTVVPGLRVSRVTAFDVDHPPVVLRGGLPVVRLERAVVESWPELPPDERRAPSIIAVRERLTTPHRLLTELAAHPTLLGHADLARLVELLLLGCHSALEIWGHDHVFTGPGMPPSRAQVPVRLGQRTIYLDRFFDREQVDVELDGSRWHASPEQRERDLRRDSALAARGILVIRFTDRRLLREPADTQAELLDVLASRRRQLGVA